MEFKVLASGSSGNCYRISDGETTLLLECGISLRQIQEGLDFRLSSVAGCLLSHSHGDHSEACKDMLYAGVDIYTSQGTIDALGLSGHRVHAVKSLRPFRVDAWQILPFDTVHDAEEPLGFVLASDNKKVLFATDTAYIKYKIPGLTHVLIECNYDLDVLNESVRQGRVDPVVKRRIIRNHMSLQRVKAFLRANDLSQVKQIWLLHLSADNSDMGRFKREIQALTGKEVYVA